MNLKKLLKPAFITVLMFASTGAFKIHSARADTIGYDVYFSDLGSLAGNNDLNMDFTLTNNDTPDSSSLLTFSNFDYGTGSGTGTVAPLTDDPVDGYFHEQTSHFTAGSSLSFHIDANFTPQTNPDSFAFAFFRDSGPYTEASFVPTTGSVAGDGVSYFTINFDSPTPTVSTYAGTNPAFAAPTVTASVIASPEPQTWAMMALGLGMVVLVMRRRKSDEEKGQVNGLTPIRIASE